MCPEDDILAIIESGVATELAVESCAINSFDVDLELGSEIMSVLEHESVLYVKRLLLFYVEYGARNSVNFDCPQFGEVNQHHFILLNSVIKLLKLQKRTTVPGEIVVDSFFQFT